MTKRINLNTVAKEVAEREQGKEEVNIAQIKEIIKVYNEIMIESYEPSQILEVFERYY